MRKVGIVNNEDWAGRNMRITRTSSCSRVCQTERNGVKSLADQADVFRSFNNDPINQCDPDGLDAVDIVKWEQPDRWAEPSGIGIYKLRTFSSQNPDGTVEMRFHLLSTNSFLSNGEPYYHGLDVVTAIARPGHKLQSPEVVRQRMLDELTYINVKHAADDYDSAVTRFRWAAGFTAAGGLIGKGAQMLAPKAATSVAAAVTIKGVGYGGTGLCLYGLGSSSINAYQNFSEGKAVDGSFNVLEGVVSAYFLPSSVRVASFPMPSPTAAVPGAPPSVRTSVPDFAKATFAEFNIQRPFPKAPFQADFYQTLQASLPKFDGRTTSGVLFTDEGAVLRFTSADPVPALDNYPAAGHVEGKSGIYMGASGSSGGIVFHNNPYGTCNMCFTNTPTLLPEGLTLDIVPLPTAKAPSRFWFDYPLTVTGNAKQPVLRAP